MNLFRSVPLILVIFWFYFLVPLALGRPVGGFYSALIAFVMFEAAYYSRDHPRRHPVRAEGAVRRRATRSG